VDRAPLPPHERPWRHPSELGPPAHEPTSTSGRVIIATAATLSLLLIGLLAISMTPGKDQSPQAVGSTTGRASIAGLEQTPRLPLVTPIGNEGWAITTTGAVKARSGVMSARLPNGDVVDVEIVERDEDAGLTLVSLPTETHGYRLATSTPAPDDTVAVHGAEQTKVVEMDTLSTMVVEEGSPVVDDDGDLVGLCTTDDDHAVQVLTVSTMPGTSTTTTTAPRPTTTGTATSAPPTTVPATAAPSTSAPSTVPSTRPASTPPPTATSVVPSSSPTATSVDAAATPGSS
jgi:hypothetical protein